VTESHDPEASAEAHALGSALVALTPLLAMLASARPFAAYGADDGLLAGALALAPQAAPAHPLAVLLAALFARVPLGPLPLRVALASSAAMAWAAAALYRALETGAAAAGRVQPRVRAPLAVAVLIFAFGSDALFAIDPRAHAVSVALGCAYLERISALQAAWPRLALRPLRAAAFWLGLLAFEQPALALVLLAGSGALLSRAWRAFRVPGVHFVGLAAGASVGLGAHALLLRAAQRPIAAALAGSATAAFSFAAPPVHRPELGLAASVLLLGALIALVRFVRAPAPQRLHGVWIGVALVALGASAVLARPAALLALGLCAAAVLSALAFGELLAGARVPLASALAFGALLLGLSQLRAAALHGMANDARASDVLREPAWRALPPRALLFVAPDAGAALRSAELEERARPDVHVVLKPWQFDLIASQALARARPELQPLLRAILLQGELPLTELQSLAARGPLLLELDPARERALYPALLPWGLYLQVSSSAVSRSDERFAARDADARNAALDAALGEEPALRAELGALLAARARADADYYAAAGDRKHAAQAADRARELAGDRAPLNAAFGRSPPQP
jgi:hypothetical protein